MAEYSGFFNAELTQVGGENVWDRIYMDEHFAKYFSRFISNGFFPNPSTGLQVSADGTSFDISINTGDAFINGWWYNNDSLLTKSVIPPSGANDRIDRVVVRWDRIERNILIFVKQGTPAASPTPPSLRRDGDIYEISLAQIRVNRTATTLNDANITDERLNTSVCGIVHAVVDKIDTTTLYNQIQTDLNNFRLSEEALFAAWSAAQRSEYEEWTSDQREDYETWIAAQQAEYETWAAEHRLSYDQWIAAQEQEFEAWSNSMRVNFEYWMEQTKAEFESWIATIQEIINEEVATNLLKLIWDLTPYSDAEYDISTNTVTIAMRQQKAVGNVEYPIQFKAPIAFNPSHTYILHNSFENIDTTVQVKTITDEAPPINAWVEGVMVQLVRDVDTLYYQGPAAPDLSSKVDKAGDTMTGNLNITKEVSPQIMLIDSTQQYNQTAIYKDLSDETGATVITDGVFDGSSRVMKSLRIAALRDDANCLSLESYDTSEGVTHRYRVHHEGNKQVQTAIWENLSKAAVTWTQHTGYFEGVLTLSNVGNVIPISENSTVLIGPGSSNTIASVKEYAAAGFYVQGMSVSGANIVITIRGIGSKPTLELYFRIQVLGGI